MSLVSKNHLSITNRMRVILIVINPLIEVLHKQLQRFQHVREIDLSSFRGPLDEALLEIAQYGVNIEELDISNQSNLPITIKDLGSKMKNIKIISCSNSYLTDSHLIRLAESLPSIEKLNLDYCRHITDEGIAAMSTKLKHLRTINLTHNKKISDQSIISLSSRCKFLTEIVLIHTNVSQAGISFVMENSHNYNSLILSPEHWFTFELPNPRSFSKCISTIDLRYMSVSDELLNGIVKADLPLKNIHLINCKEYTLNGLYSLLKAYPSLESLSLGDIIFLTDDSVRHICQFITNLNAINLEECFSLTCSSFTAIASACPRIRNIKLEYLGEPGPDYTPGSAKNLSITSATLNSDVLEELLPLCPNLQILCVGVYFLRKDVDIAFILEYCHDIRGLNLTSCQRLKFTGEGTEEVCKLEWLDATYSGIDDEILKMVGKRCPELLQLDLSDCKYVTERGVREVAEHCRRLRCIILDCCVSLNKDVVAWMVASCPSLRQIVTPRPMDYSKGELASFLKQGCLVIPGPEK